MKFAFLNVDVETVALAEALVDDGHELALVMQGEQAGALRSLAPAIRIVDEWEHALACGADATIVGRAGDEDDRLDKIRRLVQEGMPTVLVHPQSTSALAYYELDMHRQATNTPLVPYEPIRHDPAWDRLVETIESDGQFDQVICERRLVDRSRASVLTQLARDLGAVRRLTGECEKVSSFGTLTDDATAGHLGVQMTTARGTLVRWSIAPSAGGDEGSVELLRGDDRESIAFDAAAGVQPAARAVVAALADAQNPLWRAALADLELVEAVERSLLKGRTVELFHEEASEQGTFKGLMAAGGCLLLMLSIGLAVAATMFGALRLAIADLWPFALLFVLAVFLLLQLLHFAFPAKNERR